MTGMTESRELARLGIGGARRVVGLAVTGALALVLFWLALNPQPAPFGLRLVLLVLAGIETLVVLRLYRASRTVLVLTEDGLFEEGGETLAPMDQIKSVDRGLFAFRPSNGFLLKLAAPGPRRFRPGLYWQYGRRLGVGGLVRGPEAKQMADALALYLARDGRTD